MICWLSLLTANIHFIFYSDSSHFTHSDWSFHIFVYWNADSLLILFFRDWLLAAGMTSFLQVSLVISPYLNLAMNYLNPAMLKLELTREVCNSI